MKKWIIRQLRQRWMVLKEITHYLETSVNLTWRWIDKMTGKYPIAEHTYKNETYFKIITKKDIEETMENWEKEFEKAKASNF